MKRVKRIFAFMIAMICVMSMAKNPLISKAASSVDVLIMGEGGTFQIGGGTVDEWATSLEVGKSLENMNYSITADPVFFDSNRKFEGWLIGTIELLTDDQGNQYDAWVQLPNTSLMTTQDLCKYQVTADYASIEIKAQYAGDDEDYYTNVYLDMYGGEMDITRYDEEWNNITNTFTRIPVVESTSDWGITLRRDGSKIKDQTKNGWDFNAAPTKNGATFEGWIEFRQGDHGNLLISNKIYTTSEILDKVVPEYEVVFAAKWSDVAIEDYYKDDIANHFNTDDGTMVVTSAGDNGEQNIDNVCGICSMYHVGRTSLKEYFEDISFSIKSIEKQGSTFEGWTVIEYEMSEVIEVPYGTKPNIGDPNIQLVFGGTCIDYDTGAYTDTWLSLFNYYEYPNKMTNEEIMNLDGRKNHYFMANWKEATASTEPSKNEMIFVDEDTLKSVTTEVEKLVTAIRSGQVTSEMRKVYSDELINAIADAIKSGNTISTEIVTNVVSENQVNATVLDEIKKSLGENGKIAQYLDLTIMIKSVSPDGTEKELGTLKELEKEITFTIVIPKNLIKEGRGFFVLRNHEGKVDKLTLSKNTDDTYSFKTGEFSTYALAYEDGTSTNSDSKDSNTSSNVSQTGNSNIPQTGDSGVLMYGVVMVLALAMVIFSKKAFLNR